MPLLPTYHTVEGGSNQPPPAPPIPLLAVQDYWTTDDHYSIVDAMWSGHRAEGGKFPENVIPPLAVIVTADGAPAAFLACYQAVDIGVAILDWVCTPPGQRLALSRDALMFGVKGIEAVLKPEYGILFTYTLPAIARTLRREGWMDSGEKSHLLKFVE